MQKYPMTRKLSPYWSTKRGYATIALVIFVIIATIVGAVVGNTLTDRRAPPDDPVTFTRTVTSDGNFLVRTYTHWHAASSTARGNPEPTTPPAGRRDPATFEI